MTDSNDDKPTSVFDEICHLKIHTMCTMEMDELLDLKDRVVFELNRAKISDACLKTVLLLRSNERKLIASQDPDQISLLTPQQPAEGE